MIIRSRHIPFLPRILRPFKVWWRGKPEPARFPAWLEQDFASRLRLRERWEENQRVPVARPHPRRPEAYRSFEGPLWECLFRQCDAEATGAAAEFRHPFLDLRLHRYMLAVPVVPWCREKYLIRRAMWGILPDQVLGRPKSPLTGDPQWDAACNLGPAPLRPAAGLEKYVDFIRVPDLAGQDMMNFQAALRPRTLNYWLRNLQRKTDDLEKLQSKYFAELDRGQNGKETLKAVS
jgi:asparagine synthase (glutamine-hydrolysing)